MFIIRISSSYGVEADFNVTSAALALDLALRSQRAGLSWAAEMGGPADRSRISLEVLRRLAAERAREAAERELVDQIEWEHELQMSCTLN